MGLHPPTATGQGSFHFPPTSWTVVLGAADPLSSEARDLLDRLCQSYWRPVYGYIRRRWTKSHEDAKDLTQTFFTWFLEKGWLNRIEQGRGRFRSFLKVTLENFLKDQERARRALTRGGGVKTFSLDSWENPDLLDFPIDSPSTEFDELWAAALLEDALKILRDRYVQNRRESTAQAFELYYLGQTQPTYAEIAKQLHLSEAEIEKLLKHARASLQEIIRSCVRETLSDPTDLEDEILYLFKNGPGV